MSQSRDAPTSLVWRHMPVGYENCTTEILTLYSSQSAERKLFSDDKILVGEVGDTRADRKLLNREKA